MRKNNKLSKLRKSTMKVEALENRQLLSHEALLLTGDATATDHATEFMGNTYNGFEQSSLVASYAATPGELTRVSFLDLDGDVVFADFGGNGKLTISFEQHASAVASPYLQSTTWYSQGLATLSVSGGDGSTFLSVFSLGNGPDRVDAAIIDGDPDDPNNASFAGANFMADIRAVEVLGAEDQVNLFGGLGLANTNFTGTGSDSPGDGKLTGVIAPNVRILQYLRIGDVNTADQTAMPITSIHPSSLLNEDGGVVEIAGGDLNVKEGNEIETGGFSLPFRAVDGRLSFNSPSLDGDLIASHRIDQTDFIDVDMEDISPRESDLSILFRITATTTQDDVDTFLESTATEAHNGKTIIFDTPDETPMTFDVISPAGDDFSDNNIIFDIIVNDLTMRSEGFANLTFEQDVNGLFVTTESQAVGTTPNQFDSKFNEGPIGDVRFLGAVSGGTIGLSLEAHGLGEIYVGTSSGGGLEDGVVSHADAEGIFNALGIPADNAWIQGVEIWAADRTPDPVVPPGLDLGDVDLLNIEDGSLLGNLTFFGNLTQNATGGALIHITDSDVEDGISYGAGHIQGDKTLDLRNVIKFSGGGSGSSTDNDHLTVGSIGSTGGDTNFQGQLADVDAAIMGIDADESRSVVDFGDFWTDDGDITINTMADDFTSGIGDIGRLIARDAVVGNVITGEITVSANNAISIMGSMGQWTADGLIEISSSVTTGGDWDGIRAGDHADIDGRLVIGAGITVGGNMPNGLWADGGGGENGTANYSIEVGGGFRVLGGELDDPGVAEMGTMGDIYGQYGIALGAGGSISAGSFGNITVDNGVILGTDMNTEFTANSRGYGDISVTNLDADFVGTPPTMATDMPLLSNVIFLSTSGSDGRGFGDISLNQGTDNQSIATASMAATGAGQGVGFATAGSIGNISIVGTSGVTLMASGTVGGLFFMAGDDNGPADGGTSGDDTAAVEIDSLTIQLDLTTPGTFGAANTEGGLFTVSSGVSATTGGRYVSALANDRADAGGNVMNSGADGRIGLITLTDIAENKGSGLIDAPRGIPVGTAALLNAAVIIADVGAQVKHVGTLDTTLNLSSGSRAILHIGAGTDAEIVPSEGDLVIWIL